MKVASYRELMAEQANSAVRISGAHHSSWNGRLQAIDSKSKSGGVAGWDHAIHYNPRFVDEPLQEMFRNARAHNQDPATLRSYREAMCARAGVGGSDRGGRAPLDVGGRGC